MGASALTGSAELQSQDEGKSDKGLKTSSGTRSQDFPGSRPTDPPPSMELRQHYSSQRLRRTAIHRSRTEAWSLRRK